MESSPLAYVLFLACFLLLLSSSPTQADARASPLVRNICQQTQQSFHQNYTECVKALWSDARIRSSATASKSNDLKDLAINVFLVAAEIARDTQDLLISYVRPMIKAGSNPNGTKAIKQYAKSMGSVASGFQAVVEGVKEEDAMINYTLARMDDEFTACEKELSSEGVKLPRTISSRVDLVRLYKDIGFTMTDQLARIWLQN